MKAAGVGTAAVAAQAVAAPAIAQDTPEIRWRLTSSFPKNLDIATTVADDFVKRVGELTTGKLQIKWFAPGEIVPAAAGGSTRCRTAPSRRVQRRLLLCRQGSDVRVRNDAAVRHEHAPSHMRG